MSCVPSETAATARSPAVGNPGQGPVFDRESAGSAPDPTLQSLADQCVMCGLCLPHCPTYRISLDEAESPRGRIALARSLDAGRIPLSDSARIHLDQCLACLSCQKVCPSEVQYEAIITRTRAKLAAREPRRGKLARALTQPDRLVALGRIGDAIGASHWMPRLARMFPPGSLARTIGERMPRVPNVPSFSSSARKPPADRGPVTLFRGCVASIYDRDTHAAARRLLETLGYEVRVPAGTPCCGALARHAGAADDADRQCDLTRKALDESGGEVVLVSASGCFGDLRDRVMQDAKANVVDMLGFIARDERVSRLRFRPLEARAAWHLPCTQVNVVGETAAIRALLARIPGLNVLALPEQPRCCGAAGAYFIEHPQIADRLRAEKLDQALSQRPDFILTTNIGCRIHLANGLREHEPAIPVVHPLALLAQQLENPSP